MVRFFDAGFAENDSARSQQVTRAEGTSFARYGHNMVPVRHDAPFGATSPIFSYPYERSREALDAAGARRAHRRLGRRQAALREPADRRLADAHHGDLHAEAARRLRGPGLAPDRWRGVQRGRRQRARSTIESARPALAFELRRRAIISSFRRGTLPGSRRRQGCVLFSYSDRPVHAGAGHPQGRKVVMSYVFTPPPRCQRARRRPRRALPGAPRLLRRPQLRRARQGDGLHRPRAAVLLPQAGRCAWCRCPPARPAPCAYPSLTKDLHHEIELVVGHRHRRHEHQGRRRAQAHLRLRRGPGHDAPRPAGRDEEAGPPLVTSARRFEQSAPDRPDHARRRRRATSRTPRSGCRSTARTASAATSPS